MLDVKDLRCFIAVYETRGFCRAADVLHTAQSNVSIRIKRLEEGVGAPLFERMHKGIAPTAKGDLLYKHAVCVLGQLGELEYMLKTPRAA